MSDSIFSIDVEDWFNLSGTGAEPPPSEWDRLESRLERNFHGLLELLAEGNATATCFVVGYFAKRFPQLVREAVAAGHEIASHGYFHRLIYQMSARGVLQGRARGARIAGGCERSPGARLPRAGILRDRAHALVFR